MRVVAGLAVVILIAGCTSDADTGVEDDPAAASMPLDAPVWQVGDWWTYDLSGASITWVVTDDAGDTYTVDVDDADFAFAHALQPISTVGSIGKADLDGSQDGPVHFLDFPLEMNKTWSLRWDGRDWQATVVDVAEESAEVRAEDGTGAVRVYVYDNATRWFRSMAAYDANGTELFTAQVTDHGSGYSGDYVRWLLHDAYALDVRPGAPVVETFTVPEEATDIWYTYTVACDPGGAEGDQGAGSLSVQPESGQGGISRQDVCPTSDAQQGTLEPQPGDWGVTGMSGGAVYEGTFLPRTLQTATL